MKLRRQGIVPGLLFFALAASTPGGATAAPVMIVNSGSTNMLGFTIAVAADGTATLTMQQHAPKTVHLTASTLKKLLADLAAARRTTTASGSSCIKSASFGSATRIAWQGWTSPDLECPAPNAQIAALIDDVHAIREAAGVATAPLRSSTIHDEPTASP